MKLILQLFIFFILLSGHSFSQQIGNWKSSLIPKSIHQEEAEKYASYNFTDESQWDLLREATGVRVDHSNRNSCVLNKRVYGWHPYWQGTSYNNYNWSLLSDLCYFAYEIDANTGNATTDHNWSTANVVTVAQSNGVNVTLCATLFDNHSILFNNNTSKQNLINGLISRVQARGAKGINIDFEGVASSQKDSLTSFMKQLCNKMHAAVAGSEVSIALPSVDWGGTFDVAAMMPYLDLFIIMGYDYYYSGSTTAGPTDPLFNFQTTYNYNLSKSVTYYLNRGVSNSKLLLGLPYYGRQWQTAGNTAPSATQTSSNNGSKTYAVVKNNTSGYYSAANKKWENFSSTPYYAFQIAGNWNQCFINDKYSLGKRYDLVNQRNIGGIGIWALGYDDGHTELWDLIQEKFTSCRTTACSDTIYDMGGPNRNYYDNELYTYTIAPTGASLVTLNFSSFDLETNDTLRIYNGNSTSSPLIGAYTGTNSPGNITSIGNALTLRFKSNSSTVKPGFQAIWSCIYDNIPPTTQIAATSDWITQNFTATFNDQDAETGIEKSFYQVLENSGTEWRANNSRGFFSDNFDSTIHSDWTNATGTWIINNGYLQQTNQASTNSNIYTSLTQNLSNRYLYHWQGKIEGTGTNRRAGFHFFCDDASQTNRGNSYFVWFRVDQSQLQIYKCINNSFGSPVQTITLTTNAAQWYNYKVFYDRITGKMELYVDNQLVTTWTDPAPYSTGNYISFRSGDCQYTVNDFKVYRSRTATPNILVGSANTNDIRYENSAPDKPAGRIKSIVKDNAGNLSSIASRDLNVDWTIPSMIQNVSDGVSLDKDTTNTATQLTGNWSSAKDTNSAIIAYLYAVGTMAGDSNIVNWTNNGIGQSVVHTGLNLQNGTTYYFSVRSKNGANLTSSVTTSDGIIYLAPPQADFTVSALTACEGDTISFTNTSLNAQNYLWKFTGDSTFSNQQMNPEVIFKAGTYNVSMIAYGAGGSDTLNLQNSLTINSLPDAGFSTNDTVVIIPNAQVNFTNTSLNSSSWLWNLGDGNFSSAENPVHIYDSTGTFTVSLIAMNGLCKNDTVIKMAIIRVEDLTSISGISINNIRISPNPFHDQLQITGIDLKEFNEITITDITGKLIWKKSKLIISNRVIDIKTKDLELASGVYFLNLKSENKIETFKIIKN